MSFPSGSIFSLFNIGIGPSSSHTVGPMRAARRFVQRLADAGGLEQTVEIRVDLYGSLALTGKGHGTDKALMLGMMGETPEGVDPAGIDEMVRKVGASQRLLLLGRKDVAFSPEQHFTFHYNEMLPAHSNGMRFSAIADSGQELAAGIFYSVGGGTVLDEEEVKAGEVSGETGNPPFAFQSGAELLALCKKNKLAIHELVLENEKYWHPESQIRQRALEIWEVMQDCVKRGCNTPGVLPGGLRVSRRAPRLYRELTQNPEKSLRDPLSIIDWVNLYALAVNEENAAGGRMVTAPTNGAAGIVPAVLHYYQRFTGNPTDDGILRFLLTAGAIGLLYKKNASISGAEVGCQGEVGVACSMAAGGLVSALGGSNAFIEYAAEVGMEHNLGLTCDPVGGLVQIPCIERNAMGAVKAINAARIAMQSDGTNKVSLDQVIATMRQTGRDMQAHYKETAKGGLAVNVVEC